MVKKFVIWDSQIDLEEDGWKSFLAEDKELHPDFYEGRNPEEAAYEAAHEANEMYLEDERVNLDIELKNPILVIADLGLWNGRKKGYKIIESGNIKDIFQSTVNGQSECKWYCNGLDIIGEETHHDGTNYYMYREIKDMDNIEKFTTRVYYGDAIPRSTVNKYTRSLAKDVARVYGHCA